MGWRTLHKLASLAAIVGLTLDLHGLVKPTMEAWGWPLSVTVVDWTRAKPYMLVFLVTTFLADVTARWWWPPVKVRWARRRSGTASRGGSTTESTAPAMEQETGQYVGPGKWWEEDVPRLMKCFQDVLTYLESKDLRLFESTSKDVADSTALLAELRIARRILSTHGIRHPEIEQAGMVIENASEWSQFLAKVLAEYDVTRARIVAAELLTERALSGHGPPVDHGKETARFHLVSFDEGGVKGTQNRLRLVCIARNGWKVALWGRQHGRKNIDSVLEAGLPCMIQCDRTYKPAQWAAEEFGHDYWIPENANVRVVAQIVNGKK